MIFLLDTCFYSHCEELFRYNIFDIRPILLKFRLGITEKIKFEILHYNLDKFLPIDNLFIVPLSDEDFKKYRQINEFLDELDLADQSLWIVGFKEKNQDYLILTDDGELLLECKMSEIKAMRLPSFLLFLYKSNFVTKNQFIKCLKFWEKLGRYGKKELKKWQSELDKL